MRFSRIALVSVVGVMGLSGVAAVERPLKLSAGGLIAAFERGRVRFDGGARDFELSLARYGRSRALAPVPVVAPERDRDGVRLRRSGIDEWYRTDERGIEQGFTIASAPPGEGEVALDIETHGPKLRAHGGDLRADDLAIRSLSVVDADGHALAAKMEPSDDGFRIAFDDRAAKYPVVVDPYYLVEAPHLLSAAGTLDSGCTYGPVTTGLGGTYVFLGVVCGGSTHSAVYVLSRSGSSLSEVQRLEAPAPDNVNGSAFGSAIDAGDGDSGFAVGAVGINAAYVFAVGNPIPLKKVTPVGGASGFGSAVSYNNAGGAYSDLVVYSSAPSPQLWAWHTYGGGAWNSAGTLFNGKSGGTVQPRFAVRYGRIVGLSVSTGAGAKIDAYVWNDLAKVFDPDTTLGTTTSSYNPIIGFYPTILVGPQVWVLSGSTWSLQATLSPTVTPTSWGFAKDTATSISGTTLDVFQRAGSTWAKTTYTASSGINALAPYDATHVFESISSGPRIGTLTPTKANGAACASNTECTTGICVDGVCCDVACTGSCVACTAAMKGGGADGTCGPAAAASTGRGGCPKGPDAICGPDGLCDGLGACRGPASKGVSCGASSCASGMVTGKTCDGAGTCSTAPADCAPYVCKDAMGCFGSCTDDSACLAPNVCVAGSCGPKLANGKPTTAAKSCESGFSADGVCCDQACTDTCSACVAAKTGGADGTCAPVTAGTDPDVECKATCLGSTMVAPGACDGAGKCGAGAKTPCAPYGCEAGACKTKCFDDSDCAGALCVDGACKASSTGKAGSTSFTKCSAPADCASGFCVDGVCCDSACDAPCRTCALPTSPGHCVLAPSGTDPRKSCSGDKS